MHARIKGSVLVAAALVATLSACSPTDANEDDAAPAPTETTAAAAPETAEPVEAEPTQDPEEVQALDLQVGDCLLQDSLEGDEIAETTAVDCATPHDAEVFAALEHEEGDYPGEDVVSAEGEEYCVAEFETFVGEPYATSKYYMTSLYPTPGSWKFADDRITLCIILADEMVTGSLQGANA